MAMELAVETINTDTIKPSSPTPLSLKIFDLSLMDQLAPTMYTPLIFWYPNDTDAADDLFAKARERSQRLKKSLSQTLARFYPFAGRIRSNSFIECNDEGVEYIEARVNCLIQDILKQPDCHLLTKLLPVKMESEEAAERILLVKVNFFECGGMAVGVSLSHKIADLCTLSMFIKTWAAVAQGSSEVVSELEPLSSLFPPMDLPFRARKVEFKRPNLATRRFVFDASKTSILKAQAASTDVPQPTRVEAVVALIWKCAMAASTSNRGGFTKPSLLYQAVNLRKRMKLPHSENFIGNFISKSIAQATPDCETKLEGLVQKLRNGMREFNENSLRKLQGSDAISAIIDLAKEVVNLCTSADFDYYSCSSWCRFELYGADFGWGKPGWAASGVTAPNCCILMDTRDGEGVEAWLTLTEAEMAFFEHNEELLAFASVNPSVTL
ncbi:hypothetical protein DITRI_Ditri12bG0051700 [Diplodiscus trichospermus]